MNRRDERADASGAEVFISYSSQDRDRVLPIMDQLEASGVRVWVDRHKIPGGRSYGPEIVHGIRDCKVLVLMGTAASVVSRNVRQEVAVAWRYDRPYLPLLLDRVSIPDQLQYWLEGCQWIEVLETPAERWLPAVLHALSLVGVRCPGPEPDTATEEEPEPLPRQRVHTNNLPLQLTSFVGREREMAEVKERLAAARLVTLSGTGGTGKTRLALEVASDLLPEYRDGVWLVELAALTEPALVPQEVAKALGVREEPRRPLTETLKDQLASRHLLLVLDNCEHLPSACAVLAHDLLRTCPDLRILATSRQPLGIGGETVWRVPSLRAPDRRERPSVERVIQYDAVQLFIDRAVAAKPTFAVTHQNAPAVAQICYRLDGIPLAIELAAARLNLLPVEQINQRLHDRFRLLTGGSRTALPRQQTLRATLDWSCDLLSEAERALLRRLSVFTGGFTLEAAEAICADIGLGIGSRAGSNPQSPIQNWDVLELLGQLVDKSLVMAEEQQGEAWYRLLETVRQYGQEQLRGAHEDAILRVRHRDWYLVLAERTDPELRGGAQGEWLERLEREHDNLRAALDGALKTGAGGPVDEGGPGEGTGPGEAGLRLGAALWWFWLVRGDLSEGRERLAVLLELPGAARCTTVRAEALNGAGALASQQGDYAAALALYEESLAIRRELGDKGGIAASLNNLGTVAQAQGDYGAARALYEESLAISRELGDMWRIATSLGTLGNVAGEQGDYGTARALYQESLTIRRELSDKRGIACSLNNMGNVAYAQSDYAAARALSEESLAIRRELGNKGGIAESLSILGAVANRQGDYGAARALYQESLVMIRELGDKRGIASLLYDLGFLAQVQGDYTAARALHEESLAMRRELGDKRGIALSLNILGNVAYDQGDYTAARVLAEESLPISRELGNKRGIAEAIWCLGNVAQVQGDYAAARGLYEESLAISRELGYRRGIAGSVCSLGNVAQFKGDYTAAWALYDQSLSIQRELGDKPGIAASLVNLGNVTQLQGDYGAARALYEESLVIFRELGEKHSIAETLEGLAKANAAQERPERAVRLFGAVVALREAIGAPLPPNEQAEHDRQVAAVREALGKAGFAAAWAQGRAMPMDEVISYALSEPAES